MICRNYDKIDGIESSCQSKQTNNGMLRYAFEPLEGCNLFWHIVAPPPPSTPSFSLSLSYVALVFVVAGPFGWTFDCTRHSRGLAIRPTNKGLL